MSSQNATTKDTPPPTAESAPPTETEILTGEADLDALRADQDEE